jgi:hypothetical protein
MQMRGKGKSGRIRRVRLALPAESFRQGKPYPTF